MAESSSKAVPETHDVLKTALRGGAYSFAVSTSSVLVIKEICGAVVGVTKELGGANANAVEITKEVCGTTVTLALIYTGYKLLRPVIDQAVKNALGGERTDQKVEDIKPGSLHVLFRCFTDERFLEILANFESGGINKHLEKEFSEVGIEVEGLKVKIENMEEVEKTKAAINKRRSYCYPVVESEVMTELGAEDKAKKMKEKYLLVFDETETLSTGQNQGIH
ncbi:Hypothetical predicted protein [Paramuricea clavata]|uniref:Uncharacterized protein n=1 Tax=Paramuricea clavata TaxID=317549 RepID=A0A6S7JU93_PARCT|nr:Hypothetical predicted protein [Paramuricea clavata]